MIHHLQRDTMSDADETEEVAKVLNQMRRFESIKAMLEWVKYREFYYTYIDDECFCSQRAREN